MITYDSLEDFAANIVANCACIFKLMGVVYEFFYLNLSSVVVHCELTSTPSVNFRFTESYMLTLSPELGEAGVVLRARFNNNDQPDCSTYLGVLTAMVDAELLKPRGISVIQV